LRNEPGSRGEERAHFAERTGRREWPIAKGIADEANRWRILPSEIDGVETYERLEKTKPIHSAQVCETNPIRFARGGHFPSN
jgi:hypothetical protein